MAGEITVDLADAARNPSDTFSIRTQNRDFSTEGLSSSEAELLEEQFNVLINDLDSRLLTEIFLQRQQDIADVAALAKNQFDERLFGGINAADNEIGFDLLRPGHIRADPSDGSIENNWFYTHTDGWDDWIGDGTSDNDYTIDEDQIVLVLGMVDPGAYLVEEDAGSLEQFERISYTPTSTVNVDRFGRNVDMLPKDVNQTKLTDNDNDILVSALPTMVGTDRDRVHVRLQSDLPTALEDADAEVISEPMLVGLTFGVGAYMNQEEF